MVTKKDLRIDNYVFRKDLGDNHLRLEQILELGVKATTSGPIKVICDYKDLEGIPLTKEWLLKFEDIELNKNGEVVFENNELEDMTIIVFEIIHGEIYYTAGEGLKLSPPIKYVHQFQNYIYLLSNGQELKLKQ